MFRRIASDRRILLLAAECAAVIALTRWVIPTETGFRWVIAGGYWFMLAAVVIFATALWPVVQQRWKLFAPQRFDRIALLLGVGCVGVWIAQEKPGFKILADEVLLLGTSMGMHYERAAAYPIRATDIQGPFQILDQVLDKRPLLFPFLTATVHDLTGFRPSNPFYLNMVLAVVFMSLAYLVGWRAGGQRWAGLVAMVLFAGLPLMAQQSTGGGFELLNLVLLATLGLAMAWYLEEPNERRLTVLVFAGVLLANTRYESAVFLLPMAAAAIWGWHRAGRVLLSWPVALSPLFLAPVLLQNRIFAGQSGAWELAGVPGATRPFGFEYIAPNLGHALNFFFDFDEGSFAFSPYQPSSPMFALLGLLALPFFALWIARVFRDPAGHTANQAAWAILGCGLFLVTAVYLAYFWGKFDDPVIRRLSLPVHLLMALAIAVIGSKLFKGMRGWRILSVVLLVALLFHGLPVMAKRAYAYGYPPGVEMEMREEFLATLPEKDFLVIDNDAVFWITHKIPASPTGRVSQRKVDLAYHIQNHTFSQVYVFQSVLVNDQTGERYVDPEDALSPDFELETVWERRVEALLFARISRITAVHADGKVTRPTAAVPLRVLERSRTKAEQDKDRAIYLENLIKKLP